MNRWRRDVEGSVPSVRARPGAGRPATVGISETSATPGPIQLKIHGDAPAQKDELGRGSYVQALANVITNADTPLVIAIYGAWGAGKTSLMIQLRDSLKLSRASGRVARTVWFNPWMHQSDETPVLGLLHDTADQLGQLGKQRVKEALVNIGRAMAAEVQMPIIGLRVGRVLDDVAEGVYERRTQQAQLRKHFESVLDAAGRKDGRLVFFIDDLDRCRPRTALRLLEALHLFLDFENCIFVLGLDREPIEAAVAAEYGELGLRAESFLDKIIQLPFALPPINKPVINDFVTSRVPYELKACRQVLSTAAPDDPRQLKRTINVLLLSHSLVDPESFTPAYDPRVLAVVVLIQNLAPALYRILRMQPTAIHELLPAQGEDSSQDPTDSVTQIEPAELWVKYVAPAPGLAQALRLVPIAADFDIQPYLTLTSAVAVSDAVSPSHRGRMVLWSIFAVDTRDLDSILGPVLDGLNIGRSLTAEVRRLLVEQVEGALAGSLDVNLSELILAGWSKRSDLASAMRRTRGEGASAEVIELPAHRLEVTFEPPVELLVDGHVIASLRAAVSVVCEIGPSAVTVRNGLIVQARGEIEVHAQLMMQGMDVAAVQRHLELADLFEAA